MDNKKDFNGQEAGDEWIIQDKRRIWTDITVQREGYESPVHEKEKDMNG